MGTKALELDGVGAPTPKLPKLDGRQPKEWERVPPETRSEGTNPRTGIQFRYLRSAPADISLQLLCREADLLVKDSRLRVQLKVR